MRGRAIVNSVTGLCLEPNGLNDVASRQCHGGRSQEWEFDYLRQHLLGEMQWVRYLQNMKCMRFHPDENSGFVYIATCADVPASQFLKLSEWPYSRNKPKDVASSCLDRKCPECPTSSNSSDSDCRGPECVESPDILRNLVWLTLLGPSHTWFMVPVLLVFCGALGCSWKGSKLDGPTGLNQQEKKLDTMEATILHIESTLTEIAAQAPKKKLDAMEATILHIESTLTEIAAQAPKKKLDAMEATILHIESTLTEIAAQAPKKKLDAMEATILHIESTLTEIAAQAPKKKLDAMEATILHIESTLTEIAAAIDGQRGSDGGDSSSVCTLGSWTHVTSGRPCCFLQDTYFKVVTDDGQIFCPAKMLFKGSRVIAADGTVVEVLYPPEQHQVDAVIKLQVGSASLVVSPDHRILIPGNKTIQAKDLEVGSEVLLDGTEAKLTNFEWNQVPTMVMKIAFKPDIPVAAFMCAPSILSKGSRNKPRVRRGTSSRTPDGGDALTVPDTEPPLTP